MNEEDLIRGYRLEVTSPPCEPGAERYNAFAHLEVDISELMPYLNAVWPGAVYDRAGRHLQARRHGRAVTVHERMIAVSGFQERAEAEETVRELVTELNRVWRRRHETEPRHDKRRRPNALEVYRLLPRTNCKACAQASCFVFANQLATGLVSLEECPALASREYSEQRARLEALLKEAI